MGKTIIIPKGKLHPKHDKCEDCFELGKEHQKTEVCQCEFHKLMWKCPLFKNNPALGGNRKF